jgi:hypothetical protein
MSKDFRASQIETTKIILSGGIGSSTIGGIIYSGSVATNREGGIPTSMLDNVGSDVMLFVSGVMGSTDTSTPGNILFGGDIAISGSLSTKSSVLRNFSSKNSNFNVSYEDHFLFIDTSLGHVTASLLSAAFAGKGRELIFKDVAGYADVNFIVIKPALGDKIEGIADELKIQVSSGSLSLISDGSLNYHIFAVRN